MTGLYVDSIKDKSNTKTLAALSNSAVTLSDDVNLSNKYYLQLKLGANHTLSGNDYVRTVDTTNPYFTKTGDTTNFQFSTNFDVQVKRKGVYLINFSGNFSFGSTSVARAVGVVLQGGTSANPTTTLSASYDQIASTVSGTDNASASLSYVGELPVDYFLRFFIESVQAGEATCLDRTHASICLIRPTA